MGRDHPGGLPVEQAGEDRGAAWSKMAGEIAAPLQERVGQTVEKLGKPLAA